MTVSAGQSTTPATYTITLTGKDVTGRVLLRPEARGERTLTVA